MRLKVAIIDSRESYRERLASTFASEYAERIEAIAFSTLEAFDLYVHDTTVDVMLVGEDLANESLAGKRGAVLIYLVDDSSIETMYGAPCVGRYQRTDLIYKGILDACSDRFDHISQRRTEIEGTFIISFFPASGGAGASSMAAACALGAAKRGLKAFYLNLELFGQASTYFTAPGNGGLDDILFAIGARKKNVSMRVQSAVKRSDGGVFFLESCSSALDVAEISSEHFECLVREIAASDRYDVIVLDLDFAHSPLASIAMELSSRTVFVSNGTYASNAKFERLYQMLVSMSQVGGAQGIAKVVLAYNNFSSKTGVRLNGDVVPIAGGLNRVVCDTPQQLIDALSVNPLFDVLLAPDEG